MAVRAKFKVRSVTSTMSNRPSGRKREDGSAIYEEVEMRTVDFDPVYSEEGGSENKRFWSYTPAGKITLGTINPEAWEQFELGKEYFVDFIPAHDPSSR